jgi:uncharacterized protein
MLQIDLRELARGPVETSGELPADAPELAGLDVELAEPVRVRGKVQATGEGRFYWHGSVQTVVAGRCARCLAPVAVPLDAQVGALFSQEPDAADDPDSYVLGQDAVTVDIRPAVREELLLAAPRYLLCRDDCRGLCPRCGKELNAGPCNCPPAPPTPRNTRWEALEALRDKLRD